MKAAARNDNVTKKPVKTSAIPIPNMSSAKKKAKPAPNFSKLHQKWKDQFEIGKATKKKPCTVPHEFEVTKAGTKFTRATVDHDSDGNCSLDLDFEGDQKELESLLQSSDNHHFSKKATVTPTSNGKSNRSKSCSSVGRRRILGELPCDPGQKPNGRRRSQSAKKALSLKQDTTGKDFNFEPDIDALQSILNNTGIESANSGEKAHRNTIAGQPNLPQRPSVYYVPKKDRSSVIEACTAFNNRMISKLCPQLTKQDYEKPVDKVPTTDNKTFTDINTFCTPRRKAKMQSIQSDILNNTPSVTESPFGKVTRVPSRHSVYPLYHIRPGVINSPACSVSQDEEPKVMKTPVIQKTFVSRSPFDSIASASRIKSNHRESALKRDEVQTSTQISNSQNMARRVLVSDSKPQPSSARKVIEESVKAKRVPNTRMVASEKKHVKWADVFTSPQVQSKPKERIQRTLFFSADEGDILEPCKENVCPVTKQYALSNEGVLSPHTGTTNQITSEHIVSGTSNSTFTTSLSNSNQQHHDATDNTTSIQRHHHVAPQHVDPTDINVSVNHGSKIGIDFSCADDVIVYKRDLGQATAAIASCHDDSSQPSSEAFLPISTESRQQFMSHPNRTLVKLCNRNDTRDFCSNQAHGINTGYSDLHAASLGVCDSGSAVPDSSVLNKYSLQSKVSTSPELQQESKLENLLNSRKLEVVQETRGGFGDRNQSNGKCEYMCKNKEVNTYATKLTDEHGQSEPIKPQHTPKKVCYHDSSADEQNQQNILCLNNNFKCNTEIDDSKNQLYESKSYNICHNNGISATNILCRRDKNNGDGTYRHELNHRKDGPPCEHSHRYLNKSNEISGQRNTCVWDQCGTILHSPNHGPVKVLMRKDISMAMHTEPEDEDCQAASCQRSTNVPERAGTSQSSSGTKESIDKFVGRVRKNRKRQSIAELNDSISESKLHLQTLSTEVNKLQKKQDDALSSQKMHDGNGNIMYQLELIRRQQEQLLSLQIQLEQQLHTQATSYESSESTPHDNLHDRSGTMLSFSSLPIEVKDSNENNGECNNNNTITNSCHEDRSNVSSTSVESGHFTCQQQIVGQRSCVSSPFISQSMPVYFSSTPTAHSQTVLQCKSQSSIPHTADVTSQLDITPFVTTSTPLECHHSSTKAVDKRNLSGDIDKMVEFATPKAQRPESESSKSEIESTVVTPIWTPLALKSTADHQTDIPVTVSYEISSGRESGMFGKERQVEHDIDTEVPRSVHERSTGPLDLTVKPNVHCSVGMDSTIFQDEIDKCWSRSSSTNQILSPASSADQSAFRTVRSSKFRSHSIFQKNDNSNKDIGSLSLRGSISPFRLSNRNINSQEVCVGRNVRHLNSERYQEALLDDECALYSCRLQTRRMTACVEGRGRANPVARTLTEGDDMHFIPIKDDSPCTIPIHEGSAFSSYSPSSWKVA